VRGCARDRRCAPPPAHAAARRAAPEARRHFDPAGAKA
jgi:hypothetical protein